MTQPPSEPIGGQSIHLATHLFRSERLTLARELRGLTKSALADRVSKTPSAISQFESGRVHPDVKSVAALALALGVEPRFFSVQPGSELLSVDDCHFRSLRSATQRERRELIARGTILSNFVEHLEAHAVELPPENVSAVAQSATTAEEIERLAVRVREAWGLGIGPIPHLIRLLERNGILVVEIPSTCQKVDAFSTWTKSRPIVYLVSPQDSSPTRIRFDAAHELGHLIMHVDASPGDRQLEFEANRFGGAFMIPRESFLREGPRRLNWPHIWELKARWKVSAAAIVRRAFDLGMFSKATYRRAYMYLNQTGQRRVEPNEPSPERPTLLAKGIEAAGEDFTLSDLAAAEGVSVAEVSELCAVGEYETA